ncbi:MAG: LysR family transcriptional regulator [Lachnospiraceae bacterium]|nr:LysR family transcriptional regulator [Lachnospiraceae bacterium]
MELLQLRYFRTVASYESITKAAEYYHIPQPAMSQTIARLEKELGGIRLFDRKNGRLFLNDKGRTFLESVDRALNELDKGVSSVTTDQTRIAGPVRLVALENRRFILGCVSSFSALYPEVNFSISHSSDPDQLCDLCICAEKSYRQMNTSIPLIREKFVVALHESHPLAQCATLSPEQLRGEKFITLSPQFAQYGVTVSLCRQHGFEPDIPFICDDEYYVRKYVSEKMGIALAPAVSWAGRLRTNTCTIPLEDPSVTTTSYVVWDDTKYQSPAVKEFLRYLAGEAAALSGNLI